MHETGFDALFPKQRTWWLQHLQDTPTLILRCGRDGCGEAVGQVKTDGQTTLVLRYNRVGEMTVPVSPAAGMTEDEVKHQIEQRDANTLNYTADGRRVAKRREFRPSVAPLEMTSFVICPNHGRMDVANEILADLTQVVADTQRGSERKYFVFRGK
jgi:hypothetical protein